MRTPWFDTWRRKLERSTLDDILSDAQAQHSSLQVWQRDWRLYDGKRPFHVDGFFSLRQATRNVVESQPTQVWYENENFISNERLKPSWLKICSCNPCSVHLSTCFRCVRVLGTALPVESVGSSQIQHDERRAELVGDRGPLMVQANQSLVFQRQGCRDAATWEAKGALTALQQAEIEEKRRVFVEQPTAQSARKQLEQEVATLSKLESAYQRQHKAAVDACFLVAETGDKVKEYPTANQQYHCVDSGSGRRLAPGDRLDSIPDGGRSCVLHNKRIIDTTSSRLIGAGRTSRQRSRIRHCTPEL